MKIKWIALAMVTFNVLTMSLALPAKAETCKASHNIPVFNAASGGSVIGYIEKGRTYITGKKKGDRMWVQHSKGSGWVSSEESCSIEDN